MKTIKRRHKESRTDYKARLAMLKSGKPRIVVRKTNRFIIVQLVESKLAQDSTMAYVTSKDLLSFGWPKEKLGSLKSLPAAYLTGMLLAKKLKGKIKDAILDIGLHRNIKSSRIYAVLKGLLDSGIRIPHNPDALPEIKHDKFPFFNKIKQELEKW